MSDLDTLLALRERMEGRNANLRRLDIYYQGKLRREALGMNLPPEMRALQTIVNWPALVVNALEERIDVQGFRMSGTDKPDDRLWSWWQANNLDEESSLAHLDALIFGRTYVVVGYNEDDPTTPIITCESPRTMTVDIDPRTRRVTAAGRLYDFDDNGEPRSATLYLPDRTVFFARVNGQWLEIDADEHEYGQVPVVPMVNRARTDDRTTGTSEMADIIPITDAACRALTNLQGAQELLALPSRFVFGITDADMKDQNGNALSKWSAYMGRFSGIGKKKGEADIVQLPGADLSNFTTVLNQYAQMIASLSGMPPHYLGLTTDNPASADAIRSGEARHVKRAERKCKVFGGTWEEVMRLALRIVDGDVPDAAKRMECFFSNPATPTQAQTTDSVVKLYQTGLLPREAAWEELGFSPEKRARLADLTADDPTMAITSQIRAVTA